MALPYDLRELMYKGKPLWKRVIECIFALSAQIDDLGGASSSSSTTITNLTTKITELEERVEALEDNGSSG